MEVKGPKVSKYLEKFIVGPGKKIRLKKYDASWVQHESLKDRSEEGAKEFLKDILAKDHRELAEVQEVLAASCRHSILIVIQGMDTAGKDGTIKHVMSGLNPQGCEVHSFKVPGTEDHAHDFLWRYEKVLPERGMIGIFNRSYYEDVLVVHVHPERMEDLPKEIGPGAKGFWEGRYKDINAFEKHLVRNGTIVLKFFLHISKDEQKQRLIERLSQKEKYWKFSFSDIAERKYWDQYMAVYEEMLQATSTEFAPWFIVPADHKWTARTLVAEAITSAIAGLNLSYPEFTENQIRYFTEAKKQLEEE